MRLIDADAFADFIKNAIRAQKYDALKVNDTTLTVGDVLECVIAELEGTSIDGFKNNPTIEPEQRWVPTSEKLPEYDKPVLLSTAWDKTEIGFWTQRGWMIVACSYREFEQDAVTAWMPLPEPWRGDKNENKTSG